MGAQEGSIFLSFPQKETYEAAFRRLQDWTPSVSNRVWGSGESSGDVLANALYLDAGHRRKGAAVFLIDVVNRANVELIERWATRASREKWFFASASCRADHAFNKGRQ